MKHQTTMGMNRTGVASSPRHAKALYDASKRIKKPSLDGHGIMQVRQAYVNGGELGSVPPPATLKGLGKTFIELLKGERAPVLIDRLCERLSSERSAVRLYDGMLAKYDVMGSWPGGPTREEIEHLRSEELEHFRQLHRELESMGTDPTALTPAADVTSVALMGLPQVISDPRTNLHQCFEAMLIAEQADYGFWEVLANLAVEMRHDEMAGRFHRILAREARHLSLTKSWLVLGVSASAGVRAFGQELSVRPSTDGKRRRTTRKSTKRRSRPRAR